MKSRTFFEWLLVITLVAGVYYLFLFVPKHVKAGEPVVALANYFLTYAPVAGMNQTAYVVPDSLEVWDTPAEIREQVCILKSGDQVHALGHFRHWMHVRTPDGQKGWVRDTALISAETYAEEEQLLDGMREVPVQAKGHAISVENLHLEPARRAAVVAMVNPTQALDVLGRRMVVRPSEGTPSESGVGPSRHPEVWYLVRVGSHAGWILGRRLRLDIPKGLAVYAQDTNLVAWLVLDTVNDNDRRVPQYLVAERAGSEACDFTKIQVLTWWQKRQTYVIAYREKGLQGYFPIVVTHQGSVPRFRLRLEGDEGSKYQKIYGLYDTLTRRLGTAEGWPVDAMPEPPVRRAQRRRPATLARRWAKAGFQK